MGQKDLPLASGRKHAAAFTRCGWKEEPWRQGSNHIIMTKPGYRATLSIPDHDPVKRRTLQILIQAAGLTEAEYLECFNKRMSRRRKRS
ncbi:MAG: type II toxin-antitoxin system HicA family toxin [Actinomycetota bacterium]|nr:type II toxin-antitoxin system HicA family toxin [Actinomycetota bacterium]